MKLSGKISIISYYLKTHYAETMQMKCVVRVFTPLIV